jgi:hypothetical protein
MPKRMTSHGIDGKKGSTGMEWEFGPGDGNQPQAHTMFSAPRAMMASEKIQRPERSKEFIMCAMKLLD